MSSRYRNLVFILPVFLILFILVLVLSPIQASRGHCKHNKLAKQQQQQQQQFQYRKPIKTIPLSALQPGFVEKEKENPIEKQEKLIESPWFCHSRDCPPYTVRNDSAHFETRVYSKNIAFAWTYLKGRSLEKATYKGTKRIYSYRDGENDEEIKLEMTTPIATTVIPGLSKNRYIVTYYLPNEYQNNPPKPTDEHLHVFTTNYTITLAVREFGGWAFSDAVLDELAKLQQILHQENVSYCPHVWLLAQYDNPLRINDRHNEVALVLTQHDDKGNEIQNPFTMMMGME